MKNTDPLMGAKLKSKTHLQSTFFDFLSRFLRIWLQSLQKVQIWPKIFYFFFNQKSVHCIFLEERFNIYCTIYNIITERTWQSFILKCDSPLWKYLYISSPIKEVLYIVFNIILCTLYNFYYSYFLFTEEIIHI